ncbi:MAG: Lrp/AsnC family transcriptional regulator, partial [Hadesarchaea archaeon]
LIDPQKFGYGVMAFVSVDVDSRSMRELVSSLSRCHQVCELHHTTGGHGLMLKVRARDVESLKKFVDDRIQSFDSVKSVRTIVAMETIKERLLNL